MAIILLGDQYQNGNALYPKQQRYGFIWIGMKQRLCTGCGSRVLGALGHETSVCLSNCPEISRATKLSTDWKQKWYTVKATQRGDSKATQCLRQWISCCFGGFRVEYELPSTAQTWPSHVHFVVLCCFCLTRSQKWYHGGSDPATPGRELPKVPQTLIVASGLVLKPTLVCEIWIDRVIWP